MVAPNLTRETAAQRSAILTVENYLIELDLTDGNDAPGEETFSSKTTVTFTATAGASSFIDIVAARVHSAVLNGTALDVSDYDESTGISLPDLAADNELVIEADCIYSHTGEGLHRFVDPTDDAVYLYSQFETADAKRMFACFDQPDLKATFDIRVTAPTSWKVISNSAGRRDPCRRSRQARFPDHPEDEHVPGGAHRRSVRAVDRQLLRRARRPSRSASSAALRWPSSWTRSDSSPRPSRDSTSTTATSAFPMPSASTTSSSSPNSMPARWRMPAP